MMSLFARHDEFTRSSIRRHVKPAAGPDALPKRCSTRRRWCGAVCGLGDGAPEALVIYGSGVGGRATPGGHLLSLRLGGYVVLHLGYVVLHLGYVVLHLGYAVLHLGYVVPPGEDILYPTMRVQAELSRREGRGSLRTRWEPPPRDVPIRAGRCVA